MTHISLTRIIGRVLVKTSASTRTSASTSNSIVACVRNFLYQLPYPCFCRTCHTIVVRIFLHKMTPQFKTQTQPNAKPISPPSQAVKVSVLHTYLTFPFGSVTSTPLLRLMHMFQQTTKFRVWPSRSCDSVGQYTPLVEGILSQQFLLTIFLFV
jgi:hypothetical protein